MSDENKTVELKEENLEKVAGGVVKAEKVKVEIYCKDCDNVISSWQEIKGTASAGHIQITICNNCNSQNIGRIEIPLQW